MVTLNKLKLIKKHQYGGLASRPLYKGRLPSKDKWGVSKIIDEQTGEELLPGDYVAATADGKMVTKEGTPLEYLDYLAAHDIPIDGPEINNINVIYDKNSGETTHSWGEDADERINRLNSAPTAELLRLKGFLTYEQTVPNHYDINWEQSEEYADIKRRLADAKTRALTPGFWTFTSPMWLGVAAILGFETVGAMGAFAAAYPEIFSSLVGSTIAGESLNEIVKLGSDGLFHSWGDMMNHYAGHGEKSSDIEKFLWEFTNVGYMADPLSQFVQPAKSALKVGMDQVSGRLIDRQFFNSALNYADRFGAGEGTKAGIYTLSRLNDLHNYRALSQAMNSSLQAVAPKTNTSSLIYAAQVRNKDKPLMVYEMENLLKPKIIALRNKILFNGDCPHVLSYPTFKMIMDNRLDPQLERKYNLILLDFIEKKRPGEVQRRGYSVNEDPEVLLNQLQLRYPHLSIPTLTLIYLQLAILKWSDFVTKHFNGVDPIKAGMELVLKRLDAGGYLRILNIIEQNSEKVREILNRYRNEHGIVTPDKIEGVHTDLLALDLISPKFEDLPFPLSTPFKYNKEFTPDDIPIIFNNNGLFAAVVPDPIYDGNKITLDTRKLGFLVDPDSGIGMTFNKLKAFDRLFDIGSHEFTHMKFPTFYAAPTWLKPVNREIAKYLFSRGGTELAARGTQIKNYLYKLGLWRDGEPITKDLLKTARRYFLRVQDNNMRDFFNSIYDWDKAAAWITKYAPATVGAAVLENQSNNEKDQAE